MTKTILFVDDDATIREMMVGVLVSVGFVAEAAEDASKAESLIRKRIPQLILLDWILPRVSGVEFARRLRRDDETKEIPIIMLTARSEESDRLFAFEVGADVAVAAGPELEGFR